METTPLQGPRDTLPPPRRRRPWPAVVAAAGAFALAVLAATTVNPAAGVAEAEQRVAYRLEFPKAAEVS